MIKPEYLRCEYLINPLGIDVVNPRLSWIVQSEERDQIQTAYQIVVSSSKDLSEKEQGNLWDTGKVSSDQTCHIKYEGKTLKSQMNCYWKVKVWDKEDQASEYSQIAYWSMGLLSPADWKAKWIGLPPRKEKRPIRQLIPKRKYLPSPLIRHSFKIEGKIKRATLYSTALGEYELYLNGKRVGDRYFQPEWTDYNKRVQYQTYDITNSLKKGENVIGGILGDGWYRGRLGTFGILHDYYGVNLRLLVQIYVEREDGQIQQIYSGSDWKIWEEGPIRESDHFRGEVYDTQKELPGWDSSGFDDSGWNLVNVDNSIKANLVAHMNEPIRIVKEITPIEVTEPKKGEFIFNLGQNIAGWVKIRINKDIVDAKATIKLRHGEILKEDGRLYTSNLRLVNATDKYIIDKPVKRELCPHFTYHGFQYVEVTGLKKGTKPDLDFMTGHVIASDSPVVGSFESSDVSLNQLWKNIIWTQRDNMISVPTDCPQRGERMGWMGDNTAFCQTAIFNMDMSAFYSKWIKDIRDAQEEEGNYPDFVPYPGSKLYRFLNYYCAPGWADCGVILPWTLYLNYGDKELLEGHYNSAKKYIEYIHSRNPDLLWVEGIGNEYGDWLNGDEFKLDDFPKKGSAIPIEVFATIYFANSTSLLAKMAKILGKSEDFKHYSDLSKKIKERFNQEFVSENGTVEGDNQATYALTLFHDLVSGDLRSKLVQKMVKAIESLDFRISTGFMTTLPLMISLAQSGNCDIAYKLLFSRRVPSWFYMIDQGATTMWERWDGYVKGRGVQSKTMNSFNHFAIGSIGEWLYRVILGINFDEKNPGYKHIIIRPKSGEPLKWVNGSYNSIHGEIGVSWQKDEDNFNLKISIPTNTSATLYLPTKHKDNIRESNTPINEIETIEFIKVENNNTIIKIKSGIYHFKL